MFISSVRLRALGRDVADVFSISALAPQGPTPKLPDALMRFCMLELAAAVLAGGAARVDVEAHRRVDPAAVDHDALHAQHHHRGQHLLALARERAARERHQLLGIAGIDAIPPGGSRASRGSRPRLASMRRRLQAQA